jgi:hypothetical protein
MGIYRTNNVAEYDQVDGIVIDESAPPGGIQGVGTGLVILAGQFERGSDEMYRVASLQDFHLKYGKSSYPGNIQLKNKKFSALKIIRVIASDAVKATKIFASVTPVDTIQFTAKHKGVYGNKISVTIEAGSISGKKYTIKDTNTGASDIFPDEVYDNVAIASASTAFASSLLVDVAVLSTLLEPVNAAATFLATGADGTVADTDYEDAIAKAEVEGAGNFLFIDVYNATRNSYLKIHAGLTQDKMVIVSHEENDTVSDVISDVATLRDTDGRIIFAENWVGTLVDGVDTFTSPASWYASILSQTAPYVDPAYAGNAGFLYGITRLKRIHTRDEYIQLMQAGISAFEQDLDIGFKVKSGVVTQIANTSKLTVLRRRMADYLTNSIAKFLKIYQNDVNSKSKRDNVSAAINNFDTQQENLGILPRDSEVTGGKAKLIDTNSLNTNDTIAQGKFFIKYKRRIFSSMRFIVLVAEIGESVVVTEQDE